MRVKSDLKITEHEDMLLAWVLRHDTMTSVLIGASRPAQVQAAVAALDRLAFDAAEAADIDGLLTEHTEA